ncbi:glycerol-3-phosphate acyltransferase [bacterium]|nr:glycerol-3-phosphate acyltransferase [bacterium]
MISHSLGMLVLAYLLGSVPTGYLLVKLCLGVDVREHGSHGIGAINVLRVGGPKLALPTLALDLGKAWLVVWLAVDMGLPQWHVAMCALAALVGHAYSLWFLLRDGRFAEGKCVAATLGVLIGLVHTRLLPWPCAVLPLGVWVLGILGPRLVLGRWLPLSVATIAAVLSVPFVVWSMAAGEAWRVLALAMPVLVLVRHKNNLRRLHAGTESTAAEALRGCREGPVGEPFVPSDSRWTKARKPRRARGWFWSSHH